MRTAQMKRTTGETSVQAFLNIDGVGKYNIKTECGFINHMLELFTRHGRFDLKLTCIGDSQVDFHHTVEDIGILLGKSFKEALGEKKGINRYGNMLLPMDETLIQVALDISGRAYLNYDVNIPAKKVGNFDTELAEEFFIAFARELGLTLHIKMLEGKNSHHIIEAIFKGVAHGLKEAVAVDPRFSQEIPSTKGIL